MAPFFVRNPAGFVLAFVARDRQESFLSRAIRLEVSQRPPPIA